MKSDILTKTLEQSLKDRSKDGEQFVNHWSVIDLDWEDESFKVEIKYRPLAGKDMFPCYYSCSVEISTTKVQCVEVGLGETLIEAFTNAWLDVSNAEGIEDIDVFVYEAYKAENEAQLTCHDIFNAISEALEKIAKEFGISRYWVLKVRNF